MLIVGILVSFALVRCSGSQAGLRLSYSTWLHEILKKNVTGLP